MRRVGGVGVILLLALGVFAVPAHAQDGGGNAPKSSRERGFRLNQNFPNPFNPETTMSFELYPEAFETGKPVRVTIRIFNMLQQPVAVPYALNHAEGKRLVENLEYTTPGEHYAYWNGEDKDGRKVASGVYYMLLIVNGEKSYKKITVSK